ncbi:hypothetical protein ACH40F_58875, partial [Streptomyces sp. NPDC020794]|uniref:hypothetical protein n=1 Tax=unclassified Streptomyces TaxID=2593676 RepID=UPI0036EA4C9E
EAVDPALDRVPLTVVNLVELRRPATTGAELLGVADVVCLVRDGAADAASPQIGAVLAGGVSLIGAWLAAGPVQAGVGRDVWL